MAPFSSELAFGLASFIVGGVVVGWLVWVIVAAASSRFEKRFQRKIRRLQEESKRRRAAGPAWTPEYRDRRWAGR